MLRYVCLISVLTSTFFIYNQQYVNYELQGIQKEKECFKTLLLKDVETQNLKNNIEIQNLKNDIAKLLKINANLNNDSFLTFCFYATCIIIGSLACVLNIIEISVKFNKI
jgi:hypothetical protein